MHQGSLPILDRKQRSITQTLSPLYRKNTVLKTHHSQQRSKKQLSIQVIQNQYSNLNNAMDNLQSTLHKRMGYHEIELLEIMKLEIQRMLDDVKKVVKNYNQMIKEKNFSQDLWETKNQASYFKYQAFKLFQQNKNLRKEISHLKKQIQQLTFSQQCQKFALKKMAKRLAKQKAQNNSMSANHLDIKPKNKIENQKKYDTADINVQNEEDQKQTIPKRRRHDSLYSCIAKISQNAISTTPRMQEQKKNHSYIESTISHTNERKVFKTQIQNSEGDIKQDKKIGYSGRINLLTIPDRAEKLRKLKQRNSFNKNISTLQSNNQINKIAV